MPIWRAKVLYDGGCPFCRREIEWLTQHDPTGRLAVEDITKAGFDPARYGLSREDVMTVLHVVRPDGTVVKGIDAVREAYTAVGWGWLVWPTRLPGVHAASDFLYRQFAKRRAGWGARIGRKCPGGRCDAGSGKSPTHGA